MRRRASAPGALLAVALCGALFAAGPARAEFYWPWQKPPAPPPATIPVPALPAPHHTPPLRKHSPKAAPKPEAGKGDQGKAEAGKPGEPAAEPPPPPYEPQLLRLSEVIGALAFLHPLCAGKEEQNWRLRMNQLIEAEASTQPRKERLAGAFNRGFREYGQTYRRCTPAAQVAIDRFLGEAASLARELSSRYGG